MRPMDAMSLLALVEDARRALTGALVRGVYPAGSSGLWMELVTTQGVESRAGQRRRVAPQDRPWRRSAATGQDPPPSSALARRVLPGTRLDTIDAARPGTGGHPGIRRAGGPSLRGGVPRNRYRLHAELPGIPSESHPGGRVLRDRPRSRARPGPAAAARTLEIGSPYTPPPAAARSDARLLGTREAVQAALAPCLAGGAGAVPALRQAFVGLIGPLERARSPRGQPTRLRRAWRPRSPPCFARSNPGPGNPWSSLTRPGIRPGCLPSGFVTCRTIDSGPARRFTMRPSAWPTHLTARHSRDVRRRILRPAPPSHGGAPAFPAGQAAR
ncbi:MAG: hypothetical protein MZV70_04975 [Desulfobacterales bacterium]|nr:hypothetical protein [Desulfobacterales bacterium]